MPELEPKIAALEERLNLLVRTQIDFQKEVSAIRAELTRLRAANGVESATRPAIPFYDLSARPIPQHTEPPVEVKSPVADRSARRGDASTEPSPAFSGYAFDDRASEDSDRDNVFSRKVGEYADSARADFEKFIGENLISKIGIIVLVLGVGIGAKYAIDNDLISPLTRIIIGYAFGFGLVGMAIKLKTKYHNFSSVLISGGMAIMYFVTYFAYSAYGLISQFSAFALMAMFTAFTVAAALLYSRQVIAHIGLVGAYAVPFLLSNDSGNYLALFIYMAIVNLGILTISIKKVWIPIFYTSFAFTWAIFFGWFATKFSAADHFDLALLFLSVFFAIFFAAKAAQRQRFEGEVSEENLIGALLNGTVFFLFCFGLGRAAGEGQLWLFFFYLGISAAFILTVSFRFYKQVFVYLCFPFVWLIFGTWFVNGYDPNAHFGLAVTFTATYFAVFYITMLFHRLVSESFSFVEHATAILSNSFIAYALGYSILDRAPAIQPFLGLYTAANSALHLIIAHVVSRFRPGAVDVVQVLTILVLTFASIAVPVQFDGNVVTLVWCVEGALLFWYGRTHAISLFENFSYPVMLLATGSMFLDWFVSYSQRTSLPSEFNLKPITNGDLATAMVFVITFGFIFYINRFEDSRHSINDGFKRPFGWLVGSLTLFVLYNALRIEIDNYHHIEAAGVRALEDGYFSPVIAQINSLNTLWQIDYTMAFLTCLGTINILKFRSRHLALANVGLGIMALGAISTVGMLLFNGLRVSYMLPPMEGGGYSLNIIIRYISYLAGALLLYVLHRYAADEELTNIAPRSARVILFETVAYGVGFIALSCELVNLMGQMQIGDSTKLGLSILWGIYALFMIIVGIARDRKHLRFAAFALLAVTLVKLFLYDIADLDTIPKTILFITLGLTLLVISFLYNKYKNVMFPVPVSEGDR